MFKKIKPILGILLLTGILISPYFIFAGTALADSTTANASANTSVAPIKNTSVMDRLRSTASVSGPYNDVTSTSLAGIIGLAIQAVLSILGIIFLILMVVAGYRWMTADGNEQKVEKSQDSIRSALIGLILTISAYTLWQFIFTYFIQKA
jgi:uncharacterized membrane protein